MDQLAREGPPLFYTNHMDVAMTIFGLSMRVGVRRQDDTVSYLCELQMSPQHAKVLCGVLAAHIKAYEEKIGPITIPAEKKKP
jgi:hypothetical protein